MPKSNIQAFLRIRPALAGELAEGECSWLAPSSPSDIEVGDSRFAFDRIFGAGMPEDQQDVWEAVQPLADAHLGGLNVVVFSYGQTGSGKTHTVSGPPSAPGLVPRALEHAFSALGGDQTTTLKVSYVELYANSFRDLLQFDGSNAPQLKLREVKNGANIDVEIVGARTVAVATVSEALALFVAGAAVRATAATDYNAASSRSHAIFTLHLEREITCDAANRSFATSKFHIVDLAGSEREGYVASDAALPLDERAAAAHQVAGQRRAERIGINAGLLELRQVITALSSGAGHVPYRNSRLTHFLRSALGGDSLAIMIGCVSPSEGAAGETVRTMTYTARARAIVNEPQARVETRPRSAGPRAVSRGRRVRDEVVLVPAPEYAPPPPDDLAQVLMNMAPQEMATVLADSYNIVSTALPAEAAAAREAARAVTTACGAAVAAAGASSAAYSLAAQHTLMLSNSTTNAVQALHQAAATLAALGAGAEAAGLEVTANAVAQAGLRQGAPTLSDIEQAAQKIWAGVAETVGLTARPASSAGRAAEMRAQTAERQCEKLRARLAAADDRADAATGRAAGLELRIAGLERELGMLRASLADDNNPDSSDVPLGASQSQVTDTSATTRVSQAAKTLAELTNTDIAALSAYLPLSARLTKQQRTLAAARAAAAAAGRAAAAEAAGLERELVAGGLGEAEALELTQTLNATLNANVLTRRLHRLESLVEQSSTIASKRRSALAAKDEAELAAGEAAAAEKAARATLERLQHFSAEVDRQERLLRGGEPGPTHDVKERAARVLALTQCLETAEARAIAAPLLGKIGILADRERQAVLKAAAAASGTAEAEQQLHDQAAALCNSISIL